MSFPESVRKNYNTDINFKTQFAVLGRDNQTITVRYFLKEDA